MKSSLAIIALSCAVLAPFGFAVNAWAHQVLVKDDSPEGTQAYNELESARGAEYADGVARYCGLQGIPLAVCAGHLKSFGGSLDAAATCGAMAPVARTVDMTIAHPVGSAPGTKTNGDPVEKRWHQEYRTSEESGEHAHDWSPELRQIAAEEFATQKIEIWKQNYAGRQTESSLEAKAKMDASATFGKQNVAGGGISAGAEGKYAGTEKTVGPTKEEIDAQHEKFYKIGYTRPDLTGTTPDITCYKGKEWCETTGPRERNPDFVEAVHRQEREAAEAQAHARPHHDEDLQQCHDGGTPPKPFDQPISKPQTENPSFVAEDASSSPNALEKCLMEELKKRLKDNVEYGPDYDGRTLKQRAEEALAQGLCMQSYYGADYCRRFNQEKLATTTTAPGETTESRARGSASGTNPGAIDMDQPEIIIDYGSLRGLGCYDGMPEREAHALGCPQASTNAHKDLCDKELDFNRKKAMGCFDRPAELPLPTTPRRPGTIVIRETPFWATNPSTPQGDHAGSSVDTVIPRGRVRLPLE